MGAVHVARNPGEVPAVATWQTGPALRTGEFHCAMAAARKSRDVAALVAAVEEYADVCVPAPMPE